MISLRHEYYLKKALALAEQRRGFCAPNPAVGALVVKNNQILAEGLHYASGQAHAEVNALSKIGKEAKDATIYVTLEPCCHWGKTPPCTQLLIERGIKTVVYAFADPNPLVANKSRAALEIAGIDCIHFPLPEINTFYASYDYWQKTKLPWVTAKLAISSDGKIAGPNGEPIAITGEDLKTLTHQYRKRSDALLTTAVTILNDDPQLNVRLENEQYKKPIYILDSHLRVPITAKIFSTAEKINLFCRHDLNPDQLKKWNNIENVKIQPIEANEEGLSLTEVLKTIGQDGIHDLWIEAGGRCFSAFIQQHLVQRALIYHSTKSLGNAAQPAFPENLEPLTDAHHINWYTYGQETVCEIDFFKEDSMICSPEL